MPRKRTDRLPAASGKPYAAQPHRPLTAQAKLIAELDAMGMSRDEIAEAVECRREQVSVLRSREDYRDYRDERALAQQARIEPLLTGVKARHAELLREAQSLLSEALKATMPENETPNWTVRLEAVKHIIALGGMSLFKQAVAETPGALAGAAASATLVVHLSEDGKAQIIEGDAEEVDPDGGDREGD